MSKKQQTTISSKIAFIFIMILIGVGAGWFVFSIFRTQTRLPVLGEPGHVAGAFSFTNQDGNVVTNQSVENKVTVVEYFFTTCPSICPVMNENLSSVYQAFRNNTDFMILSHTVDPETDSVPVMKKYANRFHATAPSWQFLTGDKQALYKSANQDYLLSAQDSGATNFIHTQYIALLDRKRQIRGFYDATKKESIEKLKTDVNTLLNN